MRSWCQQARGKGSLAHACGAVGCGKKATSTQEKIVESPLDSKEIKPVNPKGTLNIHWKD